MGKRKKTRDGRMMSKAGKRSLDIWLQRADPYDVRGYHVHQLGFASYADYLSSPMWWKIRRRVMEQHECRCAFCLAPATAVHHASYKKAVLNGSDISPLYPVCEACHHFGEFAEDGRKTRPEEATERMYDRARENRVWVKRTENKKSKKAMERRAAKMAKHSPGRLPARFARVAGQSDAELSFAGAVDLDRSFRRLLAE